MNRIKTVYGWYYPRERLIRWSPVGGDYTERPTYELIEHRGKWTVTFLGQERPDLILETREWAEAVQAMCWHADRAELTHMLMGMKRK